MVAYEASTSLIVRSDDGYDSLADSTRLGMTHYYADRGFGETQRERLNAISHDDLSVLSSCLSGHSFHLSGMGL